MSIEFDRGKAYTVDRGAPTMRNGQGMLAGMGVVFKHFRDAMTKKLDNPAQTSGIFTVQYPEEVFKLPEASRNFPILLYEDATGQELCTSCFQCERICPPQVIHITQAKDPVTGKAVPAVAEFLLEYDVCMSCGLCAEVCPFDAIKMDHAFELSTDVHGGLTIDRSGLDRPISYYEQLAPTFWAEVKDGALKKLQGTVKRRTGMIGIAPEMVEETLKRPELRTQNPAVAPELPLATEAQTPSINTAPGGDAKAEKAAKLAAIRATNARKDPDAPGTESAASIATPVQVAPATDAKAEKAAKLAAIRAANAKKDASTNEHTSISDAPAEAPTPAITSSATPPLVAPGGDAKAEKAAKLAAIRAANAKKSENPEGRP